MRGHHPGAKFNATVVGIAIALFAASLAKADSSSTIAGAYGPLLISTFS